MQFVTLIFFNVCLKGGAIHLESLKATLEEECADLSAESRCREFEKNMDSLAQLTNAAKVSVPYYESPIFFILAHP